MSRGTTVPLSPSETNFPQLLGSAERAAHLSQFFESALCTTNPMGGRPGSLSTSGGFPPRKVNTSVHPEVPTGILIHVWHASPGPRQLDRRTVVSQWETGHLGQSSPVESSREGCHDCATTRRG